MNILFISMDSVNYESMKTYGILDDISEIDLNSYECYTCAPYTSTSHISMLTGLFPYNHGRRTFDIFHSVDAPNLFEVLRKAGYKTHLYWEMPHFHWVKPNIKLKKPQHLELKGKNNFVFMHFEGAHVTGSDGQSTRTGRLYAREEYELLRGMYYERVWRFWQSKIIPLLKKYRKQLDIIFITADHGDTWNEDGFQHGKNLATSTIKVPLITNRVLTEGGFKRTVDIVPTICDFAKVKYPKCDGLSLRTNEPEFYYAERWSLKKSKNNDVGRSSSLW